jgi:hypothetical protein
MKLLLSSLVLATSLSAVVVSVDSNKLYYGESLGSQPSLSAKVNGIGKALFGSIELETISDSSDTDLLLSTKLGVYSDIGKATVSVSINGETSFDSDVRDINSASYSIQGSYPLDSLTTLGASCERDFDGYLKWRGVTADRIINSDLSINGGIGHVNHGNKLLTSIGSSYKLSKLGYPNGKVISSYSVKEQDHKSNDKELSIKVSFSF